MPFLAGLGGAGAGAGAGATGAGAAGAGAAGGAATAAELGATTAGGLTAAEAAAPAAANFTQVAQLIPLLAAGGSAGGKAVPVPKPRPANLVGGAKGASSGSFVDSLTQTLPLLAALKLPEPPPPARIGPAPGPTGPRGAPNPQFAAQLFALLQGAGASGVVPPLGRLIGG